MTNHYHLLIEAPQANLSTGSLDAALTWGYTLKEVMDCESLHDSRVSRAEKTRPDPKRVWRLSGRGSAERLCRRNREDRHHSKVKDVKHIVKKTDRRGFTLIELMIILILAGIIIAVVISGVTGPSEIDTKARVNVIKNHLRYAQSQAMKRGAIWGIKCDSTHYWLFKTTAPDTPANQVALPGESSEKIQLADNKITMTSFTIFFDATGRPYTAYTDEQAKTPLGAILTITVDSIPAGTPETLTITPETGFIP